MAPEVISVPLEKRLKVVQGLEDSMMKNVIRSVQAECSFLDVEELRLLFAIVKNEQLQRQQRWIKIEFTPKSVRELLIEIFCQTSW